MNRNTRVSLLAIIGVGLLVALLSTALAWLYTDWLWFVDVGYAQVFIKTWLARLRTAFLGSWFFGVVLLFNLLYASRASPVVAAGSGEHSVESILEVDSWRPVLFCTVLSHAIASLVWVWLFRNWLTVECYLNALPFGYPDPIFNKDAGFYVFQLPFYSLFYQYLLFLVIATLLGSTFIYLITGAIGRLRGSLYFSSRAKTHLSLVLAALWVVVALGLQLSILHLVYSPRGVVFGASYTDMAADLPVLQILTVLSLLASAVSLLTSRRRSWRAAATASLVLLFAIVILRYGYTTLVQQVVVGPNEIAKERPFIEHNIRMTRKAFALDKVVERPYPAVEDLSREALEANRDTISNIRLWDWRPLRQTFSQLQEMRLYYSFGDVDVDRYVLNGAYRQVCVAVRELNVDSLASEARTWVNRHLKFTHGHGIVMSFASEAGTYGLPVFIVRDIPPVAPETLSVKRPEVYFGQLTHQYVIVGTTEDEFDYPLGDQNMTTRYEGSGGVHVGSLLRRLAFMLRYRNYEILLSRAITNDSRILYDREIYTRVSRIAPFLKYDGDAYPVLSDGRIYWIVDAYTTSHDFPYSEPSPAGFNYIRNTVKVVIDAYTGETTFYLCDPLEPIAGVYGKIFPALFTPYEEMCVGLKSHVRYPADLFEAQAHMFLTYHMQDPVVFYNKEDVWAIPPAGKEGHEMRTDSFYMLMRLPGEAKAEYVSLMAFTPLRRQNMTAWLAARSDAPYYGQLILYKFPKERLVFGPRQVDARIDQNPEISERLTLWGQGGSAVIRGNVRVIPINGSILYVEPLYIQGVANRLPELKRVIVAYGDRIAMEETLDQALDALFGRRADRESPALARGEGIEQLAARAYDLYMEAKRRSQAGDWAGYGRALDELGDVLREIRSRAARD